MSHHSDRVSQFSLSPNGQTVATAGGKQAGLWRRDDGAQLWLVPADKYEVTAVLVHSSGCVVSAGSFGTVAVLEGGDGRVRHTIELGTDPPGPLFELPDGRVAVGSDEYEDLFLLDVATGKRHDLEAQGEQGSSCGVRVEGSTLASLGLNAGIVRWNLETLAFINRVPEVPGECVGWFGERAVTLAGNTILLWSSTDGSVTQRIESVEGVKEVYPSPDGQHLGVTTKTSFSVVNASSGALLATFELGAFPRMVTFAGDGKHVLLGTTQAGRSLVKLLAVPSLQEVGSYERATVSKMLLVDRTAWLGGEDGTVERRTF